MRWAVDEGRPARRPISAAVCTVRSAVNVSSTRTIRSVIESPDGELAMPQDGMPARMALA